MISQINQLITRFENLSLRERGLVLLVIMALIYALWDFFLMQPLEEERQHLSSLLQYKQKHLNTLNQSIQKLTNPSRIEPEAKHNTMNTLRETLIEQENHIPLLINLLISRQNILTMLKSLLLLQAPLILVKLETQVSQPLSEINAEAKLFKHSLRIEFTGNYMDILAYLRLLENLPWKLYWDNLDIVVDNYPPAHVTLTVHTFSRKAGWGGL